MSELKPILNRENSWYLAVEWGLCEVWDTQKLLMQFYETFLSPKDSFKFSTLIKKSPFTSNHKTSIRTQSPSLDKINKRDFNVCDCHFLRLFDFYSLCVPFFIIIIITMILSTLSVCLLEATDTLRGAAIFTS